MAEARLNVRIPDELDQELEVAIARRRAPTKQAAAIEALEAWLSKGISTQSVDKSTDAVVPVGPRTESENWDHTEAHEALEYILQHGPPGMAADILGNLKWFALAARANDAARGQLPGADGERIPQLIAESIEAEQADTGPRRSAGANARGKKPGEEKAG